MVVWSSFSRIFTPKCINNKINQLQLVIRRPMSGGHGHFQIVPSRWQWYKFKDFFHFYAMVGLIPVGVVIFLSNVFIGPATLTEIPEGYIPKEWEYYPHPITRFLIKYNYASYQQDYEKYLHYLHEEDELIELRKLENQIKSLMSKRLDYLAFDDSVHLTKYYFIGKEKYDRDRDNAGY